MSSFSGVFSESPSLTIIAGLVSIFFLWHRFRQGNARLSKQKTQRLYDLARTGKWRTVGPIALQMAVRDAFDAIIDDRWICIAMERHHALRMLVDCKNAAGMLVVDRENKSFIPAPTSRVRNYRAWSIGLFLVALAPWLLLLGLTGLAGTSSLSVVLPLFLAVLMVTPFMLWLSACTEAAYRLVHELGSKYPLIEETGGRARTGALTEQRKYRSKAVPALRTASE
jgi:hypothetical protein